MGTVGPSGGKMPGMRWLILRLGIVKARAIRTRPNRNQGVHKACTFALGRCDYRMIRPD